MIKEFVEIKNEVINKKNCTLFLGTLIIAAFFYLMIMSNNLTNTSDGLWNGNYYYAQEQEIMSGRWLWYYTDILIQGIKAEPFITFFSLIIFSLGNVLLCELLNINKSWQRVLISLLILLSTSVCCQLSYKHQSYAFALSYFFSILAAFLLVKIKSNILSSLLTISLLILTLALYQSEIGCFCLAILFYLIIGELDSSTDTKRQFVLLVKAVIAVIIASIIYKISWDVILKINGLALNTYKGANTVSLKNILLNLPNAIVKTYIYFYDFYFEQFMVNTYPSILKIAVLIIITIVIVYCVYGILVKKKNNLFSLFLFLVSPIACNFSVLYIDAGIQLQQTLPILVFMSLSLCAVFKILDSNDIIVSKLLYCFTIFIGIFVLFGNILQTQVDIESMREGKISTENIVNLACNSLAENDLLDSNRKYYFIGEPYKNDLFNVTELWSHANSYAQYGRFGNNAWVIPTAYQAVINNIGINIKCNFSSNEKYNEIIKLEEFKSMPCYPNQDSIKIIDDYVIVKVSNSYIEN